MNEIVSKKGGLLRESNPGLPDPNGEFYLC
jgi:hypothetical protein